MHKKQKSVGGGGVIQEQSLKGHENMPSSQDKESRLTKLKSACPPHPPPRICQSSFMSYLMQWNRQRTLMTKLETRGSPYKPHYCLCPSSYGLPPATFPTASLVISSGYPCHQGGQYPLSCLSSTEPSMALLSMSIFLISMTWPETSPSHHSTGNSDPNCTIQHPEDTTILFTSCLYPCPPKGLFPSVKSLCLRISSQITS